MRTLLAIIALAGAVGGCDAKAATPAAPLPVQDKKAEASSYTATVKIDDV
jgi:nitrous oxide reductase accessory protein NosL